MYPPKANVTQENKGSGLGKFTNLLKLNEQARVTTAK